MKLKTQKLSHPPNRKPDKLPVVFLVTGWEGPALALASNAAATGTLITHSEIV